MKRIILTTVVVTVFHLGYTQVVNFGVKAGLMSTSMPMKGIGQWDTSSNVAGQVGAYVLKDFPGIFLQLEVDYYISMGVTFKHNGGENVDVSFNALVIPLLVGKKFERVRVFLGPYIRFADGSSFEDAQAQMDLITSPATNSFNTDSTIGLQLGMGIDISKFNAGLRYEFDLSDQYQFTDGGVGATGRFSSIILTLAYGIN